MMNQVNFATQVEVGLRELKRNDIIRFGGMCALRALPFLAIEGHFNYWKADDRQKHLYAIFYAIDCILNTVWVARAAPANVLDIVGAHLDTPEVRSAACAKARSIFSLADSDASYYVATIVYDNAASSAARAGSYTLSAFYAAAAEASRAGIAARAAIRGVDKFLVRVNPAVYNAYDATSFGAAVYGAHAASYNAQFYDIILQDIELLKNGESSFHTDTKIYGQVWEKFQQALINEGCAYWARLYGRLFADRFAPDFAALQRRMGISPEIRNKGAKAVADVLEEMETGRCV